MTFYESESSHPLPAVNYAAVTWAAAISGRQRRPRRLVTPLRPSPPGQNVAGHGQATVTSRACKVSQLTFATMTRVDRRRGSADETQSVPHCDSLTSNLL